MDRHGTLWSHETVLGMRVSELLERHDQVLPLLLRNGFTPLDNPALRRALAPTVTLAQALRLNPLSAEDRHELLEELTGLCLLADSGDPPPKSDDPELAPHRIEGEP